MPISPRLIHACVRLCMVLCSICFTLHSIGLARADATCPTNEVSCGGSIVRSDSIASGSCSSGQGSASWAYDLTRGMLSASADGWADAAWVTTNDDYTVNGVPAGTPLVFKARLEVGLSQCSLNDFCCFGSASAELAEGAQRVSAGAPLGVGCHGIHQFIELDITHLAGEVFRLEFVAKANGVEDGSGSASGTLSFEGLPVGAIVSSCHGYQSDLATNVRRMTWGRLKTIYR